MSAMLTSSTVPLAARSGVGPGVEPYLSVVVPAYNESQRIEQTVKAIQSYLDRQGYTYEVIVSADGEDGTREKAAELARHDARISVIGTPQRGGKGRGIRNGVMRARGKLIGFVDADYKAPIEELEKLMPFLLEGYDVVIGSRRMEGADIHTAQPLYRRLGSKVFAAIMRVLVGLYGIRDTQCGIKFFQGHVARDLFSRQSIDGYMFDVEVLRLAVRSGYRIKEVGIRWGDDGDSRYNPIGGTMKNARELLKIRFSGAAATPPATHAPIPHS